jgi:hypothetical protein
MWTGAVLTHRHVVAAILQAHACFSPPCTASVT